MVEAHFLLETKILMGLSFFFTFIYLFIFLFFFFTNLYNGSNIYYFIALTLQHHKRLKVLLLNLQPV